MAGARAFGTAVAFCTKCRQAGRPVWAPPIATRVAIRQFAHVPSAEEGPRRLSDVEVNGGLACIADCPEVEHLHWVCGTCGFTWVSATADAR